MKQMSKTNFILYKDSKAIIDLLSDEQAGKLFKSIFQYVEDRTELETNDGMLKIAFTQIKVTLERDLIKYKKIVERNKENGKKGGRPTNKDKETQSIHSEPNKPSGLNGNPKEPKKADSVIDNGIDIDSDIDNDNKKSKPKKRFTKPNLKELELFCKENSYAIDCSYFIDYYESNGWKVGKNPMKDWKATVRNWARKNTTKQEEPKDLSRFSN